MPLDPQLSRLLDGEFIITSLHHYVIYKMNSQQNVQLTMIYYRSLLV